MQETRKSEFWLVRHGETEWSLAGKHTGSTDVSLTARGRAAAAALHARLTGIAFSRILTSPLLRARETCTIAGFGEHAEVLDDLREWNYGQDEGLTTAQIRQHRPGWTVWEHGPSGGETLNAMAARADRVIANVRKDNARVLAFCHGHMSRVLGARWIEHPVSDGAHLRLDTAAVCILGWERETPVLKLWNDVGRPPA